MWYLGENKQCCKYSIGNWVFSYYNFSYTSFPFYNPSLSLLHSPNTESPNTKKLGKSLFFLLLLYFIHLPDLSCHSFPLSKSLSPCGREAHFVAHAGLILFSVGWHWIYFKWFFYFIHVYIAIFTLFSSLPLPTHSYKSPFITTF